jgi:predicted ABC-type transport system involved in lysophospholipase L1 biosynthesis ATPase subunit
MNVLVTDEPADNLDQDTRNKVISVGRYPGRALAMTGVLVATVCVPGLS